MVIHSWDARRHLICPSRICVRPSCNTVSTRSHLHTVPHLVRIRRFDIKQCLGHVQVRPLLIRPSLRMTNLWVRLDGYFSLHPNPKPGMWNVYSTVISSPVVFYVTQPVRFIPLKPNCQSDRQLPQIRTHQASQPRHPRGESDLLASAPSCVASNMSASFIRLSPDNRFRPRRVRVSSDNEYLVHYPPKDLYSNSAACTQLPTTHFPISPAETCWLTLSILLYNPYSNDLIAPQQNNPAPTSWL